MTMTTQNNVSTSFLLQSLLSRYNLATLAWPNNEETTINTFICLVHWYIITQIIVSTMIYWMLHNKKLYRLIFIWIEDRITGQYYIAQKLLQYHVMAYLLPNGLT